MLFQSREEFSTILIPGKFMLESLHLYSDKELFFLLRSEKKVADAAFTELHGRYGQRLYAYCLRVTGNEEEARDIFQETFIKFYRSAAQERVMTNVAGFLIRIARNLCLNYKRDKKDNVEFDAETVGDSLVQSYEQKELLELIGSALGYLEFDQREAFVLRLYHGLSYDEIAEITGDTVNAVRNRVFRAKEKVKTILSPYLIEISKL